MFADTVVMFQIRCDSGVEEGSEISVYYDSMICKVTSSNCKVSFTELFVEC